MVEVFKNSRSLTGKEVDETIRREVFILVCSQLESVGLFVISSVCLFMSKRGGTPKWNELLMVFVIVASLYVFVISKIKFKKKVKNIIIENKQVIYSCHEIKFTEGFVYVNNIHPIKMDVENLIFK